MTSLVLLNELEINSHVDYNVGHFDCSLILEMFLLRKTNSFNEAQVVLGKKLPRGLVRLKINLSLILLHRIQTVLDCRVGGIKVSSYRKYKVKNGLCIEQLRNLGQNGTCYYIVFDEWKDILMYTVYVVALNQNTPVVGKTLFWGPGGRGNNKFLVLFRGEGEQKIFI